MSRSRMRLPFSPVIMLCILLSLIWSGLQARDLSEQASPGHGTSAIEAQVAAPMIPTQTAPSGAASSPPSDPDHTSDSGGHSSFNNLLLGLLIILLGAKLGGEIFERFGQPAVIGEILIGVLLGNLGLFGFHLLDFIRHEATLTALAELGVIILLFEVGLESNLTEMRKLGASSLLVATLGVVAPMLLGWGASAILLPHEHTLAHLFVGATLCATSVGITARVLKDLGQLQRKEAQIVLGAAVIDDIMGLVVLAVVSGLITATVSGGTLSALDVGLIVAKAMAFLVGSVIVGRYLAPRLFRFASILQVRHMLLVTSLAFCFLLALLASSIQLAPIVGAFAAGLILDPVHYQTFRDRGEHTIEELLHPISGFLVPVFFVVTGMHVDLAAIHDPSMLLFAGVLTVLAIIGKQVCSFGVLEKGTDRLAVGIGMIPRGEVGLIFANIGLTLKLPNDQGELHSVINPGLFGAIVVMVMVTTIATPPLLKWKMLQSAPAPDQPKPPRADAG